MALKKNSFITIMILFLWVLLIYGSTDGSGYYNNPTRIWKLLYNGFIIDNGFRLVELFIILFSATLMYYYKNFYHFRGFYLKYFYVILFIFTLILCNPNNNASFFEHFFANDSKFILLFSLFYSAIIFLREDIYLDIITKLMRMGFLVILYKALSNFIFYLTGNAQQLLLGVQSTLPQSDVLYFTGLTVLVLVYLYLIDPQPKKILIAVTLFIIMLLSLRRTEIISTVIVFVLLLLFNQVKFPEKGLNLKKIFRYALVPILFVGIFSFTSAKFSSILSRYISAFAYFDESLNDEEVKDSGHIDQAVTVTQSMLKNITFWGSGLQNEAFYLKGQSAARAHSNLAYAMAKQGLFVSIFFIISLILFIRELLKTIRLSKTKYSREFILLRFMALSILIMFFISGWASGNVLFDNYPQTYISYILVFSLLKLTPNGVNRLILSLK